MELDTYTANGVTFHPFDMLNQAQPDWPDKATKHRMEIFAEGMLHAESVAGVDLNKEMVVVNFGMPMPIMAQGGGLFVTPDFLSDNFPVKAEAFADILAHEAAHIKYQDGLAKHLVELLGSSVALPLMAKAAYQQNPAFFVQCIENAGITVSEFADKMGGLQQELEGLLLPLESLVSLTDKELVRELYQGADQKLIETYDVGKVGEVSSEIVRLTYMPFLQAASIPENLPPLALEQKETLDKAMQSWESLMAKAEQYAAFSGAYSRAIEHRADDFVVIHSQHPAEYFTALKDLMEYLNSRSVEEAVALPEMLATHPDVAARRERGMLVAQKLKAARLIDPEIDPLKMIAEVNREWCVVDNNKSLLPRDFF